MARRKLDSKEYLSAPSNSNIEPPVNSNIQELPFEKLSWENFEKLCLRLVQLEFEIEDCEIYGVKGQNQRGIDVFARIDSGRYNFYQCKKYKSINSTQLNTLVKKFKNDEFYERTVSFYVCTSCGLNSNKVQDSFEAAKNEFNDEGKILKKWDKSVLSSKLKKHPEIVFDFFGASWVEFFNGFKYNIENNISRTFNIESITEVERHIYLKDLVKIDRYIDRTVSEPFINESKNESFLFYEKVTTNSSIKNFVLLGNPGSGKSVELKKLAINLWENREGGVPYFSNICTFLESQNIHDYLPEKWSDYPLIYAIYDGVDEIQNITDFTSKLEKFISDNQHKNIRFIISCRTNVYESKIKDLNKFCCLELNEIEIYNSVSYLNGNYNIPNIFFNDYHYLKKMEGFIANPFYLELFGEYYKANNILPNKKAVLVETYVDRRLDEDRKKFKKLKDYDSSKIKSICKKVALTMEAMQTNFIEERYLNSLLGDNKSSFTNSCFIEKIYGEDKWKFTHRNLQEFFVAEALTFLDFDKILDFIKIQNLEKTHPSWLNSISYLLSSLDQTSNTYKQLIHWLIQNDYEVLFQSDSDRISNSLREQILQKHFEKVCIQQTLWITNFDGSIKDISRFADCENNFSYLIASLLDTSLHRRARISAMELLCAMNLRKGSREETLKEIFLELLQAPVNDVDFDFKNKVLYQIKNLEIHLEGSNYLHQIIVHLGNFDYHRVTSAVLSMILDLNSYDDYFYYIKSITPKVLDDNKREYKKKDNFSNHEDSDLKDLLLGFNNIKHLSFSIDVLLDDYYSNKLPNRRNNNFHLLIDKLISVYCTKDYEFIFDFFFSQIGDKRFLVEQEVCRFFIETNTDSITFDKILKHRYNDDSKKDFEIKFRYLAYLCNETKFQLILDLYRSNKIDLNNIRFYRNVLSNHKRAIGVKFEKYIQKAIDYDFEGDLYNEEIELKWKYYSANTNQLEFNIYLDKECLKGLVVEYFEIIGEEKLSFKDLNYDKRKDFYNEVDLRIKFPQSFHYLISDSLRNSNSKITKNDVFNLISDDIYLMNNVYKCLSTYKDLVVSIEQKQVILEWCLAAIKVTDFSQIAGFRDNSNRKELIWFFRYYFKFKFSENVLLDLLFVDYSVERNRSHKNLGYKYIFDAVGNKKVYDRILQNILHVNLHPSIFENHALYLLENKNQNSEVYKCIKLFILDKEIPFSYRHRVYMKYIEHNTDIEFVKTIVESERYSEEYESLLWYAYFHLIYLGEKEFAIKKLLLEISTAHKSEPKKEIKIIDCLVRANYSKAFCLFNEWIQNNNKTYINEVNYTFSCDVWKSYSNMEAIDDIINLFMYGIKHPNKFRGHQNPVRISIDVILNICSIENEPENLCQEIKEKLKRAISSLSIKGDDLFFYHDLLNSIEDLYYNKKSKKISFGEIVTKIDELKYDLL